MLQSILKVVRGIVKLRGNTDNTLIGNTGDRLKVDSVVSIDIGSSLDANQAYSCAVKGINAASAATDNPLMLLRNPSGSGKNIYITAIHAGCEITNVNSTFSIFVNPTVTANGTGQDEVANSIGTGAPASVALLTTLPTVSAIGTRLAARTQGQNTNSEDVLSAQYIKIAPDNSILITADPSSNNRAQTISIFWIEK